MKGQIYSFTRANGRTENQDYLFYEKKKFSDNEEITILGVCDGVGGMEKGKEISRLTAWTFGAYFSRKILTAFAEEGSEILSLRGIKTVLEGSVGAVHKTISAYMKEHKISGGSTLTAAVICGRNLFVANAGDSPCYLADTKTNYLELISEVENCGYEGLKKGIYSDKKSGEFLKASSYLTNYIGGEKIKKTKVRSLQLFPGNMVLMGSDGFFGILEEKEILQELKHPSKEHIPERIAERSAMQGETDNQSGILWIGSDRQY